MQRFFVHLIHQDQRQEHGGSRGVRDETLIESAMARPRNLWADEDDKDLADLAAAYGYGLANNHGFVDGNKRVAFMAVYTFLGQNGLDLDADEAEVVAVMLELASGTLSETDLADWIRQNMRPLG